MRAPDHFDRDDAEDDGEARSMTCNRCGAEGLHWQSVWDRDGRERSVLFEGARRHECRASADDFDDVTEA